MAFGDLYFSVNKLDDLAEDCYWHALKFYKLSNNILKQGNAFQRLGRVKRAWLHMQDAETLFENALTMHTRAQDPVGQKEDQHYLNEVLSHLAEMNQSSTLLK